jgi:hypothetical protein
LVSLAEQITEPLVTCEAVLAEAAFQLASAPLVLSMLRDGLVTLASSAATTWPARSSCARTGSVAGAAALSPRRSV